jgi:hypothetical protein
MKYLLLLVLLFTSGCMSEAYISEQVARCPQFVRDNVGEIKYMPVSWGTVMGISGVTDKTTGEIWLTAWADKHTILHEIGHSVYFRVPNEEFTEEFRKQDGFVSIWSMGLYEEIAEAFYEGMQGRSNPKIDCAMEFFNGNFTKGGGLAAQQSERQKQGNEMDSKLF